jgi:hypothetical protein
LPARSRNRNYKRCAGEPGIALSHGTISERPGRGPGATHYPGRRGSRPHCLRDDRGSSNPGTGKRAEARPLVSGAGRYFPHRDSRGGTRRTWSRYRTVRAVRRGCILQDVLGRDQRSGESAEGANRWRMRSGCEAVGRTVVLVVVLMSGAAALSSTPPAWAEAPQPLEGATAIADLNAQREANGIPPITTVDQSFASTWCPHEETGPGEGGVVRVESSRDGWSTEWSPWNSAPLHQQAMYYPLWTAAGDVNVESKACMGLGDSSPRPTKPTFYDFVGERGPSDVPISETVFEELPLAPQQAVGIPQGQRTGPDLIAYALGMSSPGSAPEATSWSLVSASGEVVPDVQMVDEEKMAAIGHRGLLEEDGVMIPPELAPLTTYTASINWRSVTSETRATQTFKFTTGPPPVPTIESQTAFPEHTTVLDPMECRLWCV